MSQAQNADHCGKQKHPTDGAIPTASDEDTSVTLEVLEVGICAGSGQAFVPLVLRWSVSITIIRTILKQRLQKSPQGEGLRTL